MSNVENAAFTSSDLTSDLLHTSPTSPLKAPRMRMRSSDEATLEHYLKRLPPAVAASFTAEQRAALRTMLAGRSVTKHMVEVRRTLSFGRRRRFYVVFLFGKDRRALQRSQPQSFPANPFKLLLYLAGGAAAVAVLVGFLASAGY